MIRRVRVNFFRWVHKNPVFLLVITGILGFHGDLAIAQNITPLPTAFGTSNTVGYTQTPTPIRFNVAVQRLVDLRLEAISNSRFVFSDTSATTTNRRLYSWDPVKSQLLDTGEDGVPGTIIMPDDGSYMIFLFNELQSTRGDINGDKTKNVVMRMLHFATGQRLNLGVPARSATPNEGQDQSQFEYFLKNSRLVFSNSDAVSNNSLERDAPWHIINMQDIVYKIEGTPTPTPTVAPVVLGTPTPTFTPSPVPTPTPIPTVPEELRSNADINADGKVDHLDLLLFQYFWNR